MMKPSLSAIRWRRKETGESLQNARKNIVRTELLRELQYLAMTESDGKAVQDRNRGRHMSNPPGYKFDFMENRVLRRIYIVAVFPVALIVGFWYNAVDQFKIAKGIW